MKRSILIVAMLGAATAAHADRAGVFGEASAGVAALHEETTSPYNGYHSVTNVVGVDLRGQVGLRIGEAHCTHGRLGLVVDVASVNGLGSAIGIGADVDWILRPGWAIGTHAQISSGDGNGEPASFDGTIGIAGLRAEHRSVSVELDAIRVWHPEGYAAGAALSVGVTGRPAKYVLGTTAIAAAAVVIFIAIAISAGGGLG